MLEDYEQIIQQGINSYFEIGRALAVIQRGKLYREKYETFDQYCRERWGFGRHRGYQLIRATAQEDQVLTAGQQIAPENERQQRMLLKLPDANTRQRALARAKEIAGDKKMTGAHIRQAVDEELGIAEPEIQDAEIVEETEPTKESTAAIIPLNPDKETNEQAIHRLFDQLKEFAASVKWEEGFTNIVDELEARIDRLIREQGMEKAA